MSGRDVIRRERAIIEREIKAAEDQRDRAMRRLIALQERCKHPDLELDPDGDLAHYCADCGWRSR